MTNIYLTDSDEEAIVNFSNNHKSFMTRLMNILRTNQGRNSFTNSRKLPVQVCKTCCNSQRTRYSKLMQSKSGQTQKEMMERQNWIQDKFNFFKTHIRGKGLCKSISMQSDITILPSVTNLTFFG